MHKLTEYHIGKEDIYAGAEYVCVRSEGYICKTGDTITIVSVQCACVIDMDEDLMHDGQNKYDNVEFTIGSGVSRVVFDFDAENYIDTFSAINITSSPYTLLPLDKMHEKDLFIFKLSGKLPEHILETFGTT